MLIDNLINQVIDSTHSKWHWITALNYENLGYSDDMIGCIEIVSINQDQSETRTILSHDDCFDDFFANYGLSILDNGGVLK
ncbi:MAG: hypothetical protein KBT06_09265 [Prevotellaceae bacterium]|nr:hypothetical protein [Candidatus Colivivens equi]